MTEIYRGIYSEIYKKIYLENPIISLASYSKLASNISKKVKNKNKGKNVAQGQDEDAQSDTSDGAIDAAIHVTSANIDEEHMTRRSLNAHHISPDAADRAATTGQLSAVEQSHIITKETLDSLKEWLKFKSETPINYTAISGLIPASLSVLSSLRLGSRPEIG